MEFSLLWFPRELYLNFYEMKYSENFPFRDSKDFHFVLNIVAGTWIKQEQNSKAVEFTFFFGGQSVFWCF